MVNILSQEAYDLHDKLVKTLETCDTLEVLQSTAKRHYNEIYVDQKLNHALPLSQANLESKRLEDLELMRSQVDMIVTQRQPELIVDFCERVSTETEHAGEEMDAQVAEMLPLLEKLYDMVSAYIDAQAELIEKSKPLEVYKFRGYQVGAVKTHYELPWSPIVGLAGGTNVEKNGVVFKAIVSRYLANKSPGSAVDRTKMLKRDPLMFVQGKSKKVVGKA